METTTVNTIRIRKKLDSENLQIPELKPLIGKTVEITIEETAAPPKLSWEEIDRLVEKNAELYPGPNIGVDIIREMRDNGHPGVP
jgi:hypothetical protein